MPDIISVREPCEHHLQPFLLHDFNDFLRQIIGVVKKFNRSRLEEHCLEFLKVFGISDHNHVDSYLQERIAN